VLFWFRKLTPEAFDFLDRAHKDVVADDNQNDPSSDENDDADDDMGVTKTMINAARQGDKTWSNVTIDSLLIHQEHMLLHCRVNKLFGQKPFDWDDFQFVVCDNRGFVYKPRPRRKSTGFLADMRNEHWRWHVDVALPLCWEATTCEEVHEAKRAKTG